MLNNNYICALDIGSSKIAGVLAKLKKRRLIDISLETVASKGIKRGVIIDSIDLLDCLSLLLKKLKVKSNVNIKFIYVNISGLDIVTKHSHATIPLAERGNKVITLSDIHKVNEQARLLGSSLEEEIIHQIPFGYTIDSGSNILNPLGLYSHRLEVDLYLIYGRLSSVHNLTHLVNQAGYELQNLFFSGLATSRVVLNQELQDGINPVRNTGLTNMKNKISNGVNILCDIGSDITELLIFQNGLLSNIDILPLGGDDLTHQLSATLKIPFGLAEDIKQSYGALGDSTQIKEDREILIKSNDIYKPIKQKLICETITSKAKLICKTIKDSIDKRVDTSHIHNFVTTGRSILLEGFLETLENTLETPVKIGQINDADIVSLLNKNDILSGQKYLNYITALGMLCEALKDRHTLVPSQNLLPTNPIFKFINRAKEVYQEYF